MEKFTSYSEQFVYLCQIYHLYLIAMSESKQITSVTQARSAALSSGSVVPTNGNQQISRSEAMMALASDISVIKSDVMVIKEALTKIQEMIGGAMKTQPHAPPPSYDSGIYPKLHRPAYLGGPRI
ncbi:hypothetical protein [Taiyuan leafhopper virus]|uniref:Uncharacterized protein n=1 Tax=Taiyuan leafhopper virus TaxID=2482723 RepID=A0A455LK52_9VIRU|nr:hypothetical protein QKJ88_gp2 [Taiyuan leafhopper virus]AYN64865.1 hypothetical protein [Taiyuan leafhopper virus]